MNGCRPLKKHEIQEVSKSFTGRNAKRNLALFVLGLTTGLRINELLSLRVEDVIFESQVVNRIKVKRKGNNSYGTKSVVLMEPACNAILDWVTNGLWKRGCISPKTFLFKSEYGVNQAISTQQGYRVIVKAYKYNSLDGKLGTTAMRKSFAKYLYQHLEERRRNGESIDPLAMVSEVLGHHNLNATKAFIDFEIEDIDKSLDAYEKTIKELV